MNIIGHLAAAPDPEHVLATALGPLNNTQNLEIVVNFLVNDIPLPSPSSQ